MMRKIALGVAAMAIAFAVLLSASITLIFATLRIERIAGPAARAAAAGAELIIGAATLLAAVYFATRIAVRAFALRDALPTDSLPSDAVDSSSASQGIT
jgi:hypothetical protein